MTIVAAQVVYCDDVRMEVAGKLSIMGVYRDFIGIPDERGMAPKFVVLVTIDYTVDAVGQQVKVEVVDRGRQLIAVDVPLPARAPIPNGIRFEGPTLHLVAPIEFAGFALENGMSVRTVITGPDFEFTSETLEVLRSAAAH